MKLTEVNKLKTVSKSDRKVVLAGAEAVKDAFSGISALNEGDQIKWVGLEKDDAKEAMGSRRDLVGKSILPGRILGTELTDEDSKDLFWFLAVLRKGSQDVRFYGGSRIHGESKAQVMRDAMEDWVKMTDKVEVKTVTVKINGDETELKQWLF